MKAMLNEKTLTLIFLLLFLTLLVGCFPSVNQSPVITSTPITLAEVDELYTYEVEATDPDGDTLTYSLDVKPSDMAINSATGLIEWTPTAKGDYPVIVKVSDGTLDITQSFTIVVIEEEEPGWTPTKYYTITATAGPGGSISPSGAITVNKGSDIVFTMFLDVNYHALAVLVDGVPVGVVASYTFTDVSADHTIHANFAIDTYTITASSGANGAINPFGDVAVNHGANQSFTITPSVFYSIADISVDGNPVAPVSPYIFTNVTQDHTIDATFLFYKPVYNQDKGIYYDTIQAAIDDAGNPVNTILVAPGTYNENLVIDKSLYLLGDSSATTIIDGGYTGNTVTITASDVALSNFTITGGFANPNYPHGTSSYTGTFVYDPFGGVVIDGNDGTSALAGITIEDNIIYDNDGNGIYVSATTDVIIRNNEVYNNGEFEGSSRAGISLTYRWYEGQPAEDPWEDWRRPKDILVEGNEIHDNHAWGMYLNSGKDCVIKSNNIWGNSNKGLLMASSMPRCEIPSEYNTIELNEIYDNAKNGIKIVSFNHHNTFTANVIYGNGYGAPPNYFGYGFQFKDGDHNTLQGNVIYGNAMGGLYLWGNGDPSYTWYDTTDNTITGNTISDHTGHGIYMPSLARPNYPNGYPNSGFLNSTINGNNIMNNLTYGLENADTTQTVDAEDNWWGNETGPTHPINFDGTGDKISDNVDFSPWSTSPY